jgi:hypothetical protein
MNVNIEIHYMSDTKILQRGTFPLRGRSPAWVALEWWKHLKKEMSYHAVLDKVFCNGEEITEQVKELEEQQWRKSMDDNLPF